MKNTQKYLPYPQMKMPDRKWPDNTITKAPIWCSVDLRDGNQALEVPMDLDQKLTFFRYLTDIGFKTIEVGFPAASPTDYEICRVLIEQDLIPEDVKIQVLTQSRDEIMEKTFESLVGVKKAVVHLYNSTSTLQREVVFHFDKQQTIDLAVYGAKKILELAAKYPETDWQFEYSPESYTGTEPDFAVEICNAVLDVWKPTPDHKVIINLPSTVEMSTPNIFADRIEYTCQRLKYRDCVEVSIHAHNDRGTAVATSELALLAGADRIEGTLFGNGERTGNCDIMNMALNLYSQGVDPELDFSEINRAISIYEKSTGMHVHPRHPYAGSLVYTAFSGSHQDAIRKGMDAMKNRTDGIWAVPYLPIDPMDVGRNYDPIIRINSQSGKGGVAYILEQNYGLYLPKPFQQSLGNLCTEISDSRHAELTSRTIYDIFMEHYTDLRAPLSLETFKETTLGPDDVTVDATIRWKGEEKQVEGRGNGVLAAFSHALEDLLGCHLEVMDYREHSMTYGTKARAISYIQLASEYGDITFGAGTSSNITKSSLRALVSAINNHFNSKN
ncbi:MAG: 2-isopropylmalate synthase [Pygmaiobacter massiliensis]|nr:2-isopropylmalate synthase [Pygmaiobacter massiliensis]